MITPVTITGSLLNPDSSKPSGAMTFQLVDPTTLESTGMRDTSTDELVLPGLVVGSVQSGLLLANPVGAGPYTPLVLLANDDPTTLPVGLVYLVTEQLSVAVGAQLAPWQLTVRHAAAAGTLDISSQRPTP